MTIKFRDRLSGLSFSGAPTSNDLTNIQRAADDSFRYIANLSWNQGRLIGTTALGAAAVDVAHGLDRAWQGWLLVDKDAQQDVWQDTTVAVDSTKFLRLIAAGVVNVKLWVF